ncbi:hypothetical protein QUB11_22665, partial [Microcoleus sp. B6-A1]|uniref:hypothetical protein n=1 Tax=Microcoleus sp. B6-A1 TaxID=2818684 RepID=UPI002FD4FBFA
MPIKHPVGAGSPIALKSADRLNKPAPSHKKPFINNGALQSVSTHILHHSQEQARCLFHKKIHSLWNR